MPSLHVDDMQTGYPGFMVGPVELQCGVGIYRLAGDNGSGKTTLLRTMAAELRPRRGVCRLDGEDVWASPSTRQRIGYLSSTPDQPSFLTVAEAWRFHASLRGQPKWPGADLAEALKLDITMTLSEASAGQRRKAEWLCALAADPDLLLVDEPLAHLDPDAIEVVSGWLKARSASTIIVFASQESLPLPSQAEWQVAPGRPLRFVTE